MENVTNSFFFFPIILSVELIRFVLLEIQMTIFWYTYSMKCVYVLFASNFEYIED